MARPKAVLPDREDLRRLVDGEGRLAVRVTPGARQEALTIEAGTLHAKVRARPEDGKANAAVCALLAAALRIPPSRISLLRGATSREKQFRVEG